MTRERAEDRATRLNKYVKHPTLNYRAIKTSEHEYGVGEFLGDEQVGIV